jgi:purine nucleosidase
MIAILALHLCPLIVETRTVKAPSRPVIITTDCGASFDDQWAITHLAASPEIQILGIVTTHAHNLPPPAAEATAAAAREVLGLRTLKTTPPVISGSSLPLKSATEPRRGPGVDFLLKEARDYRSDNRLTVVMIGVATDVASAILIDPTWADRVEIVAMAFDEWKNGGDPWNVKNDLAAWRIVLNSRAPLVVGDDAVCRQDLALSPDAARARFGALGAAGAYLAANLEAAHKRSPGLAKTRDGGPPALPIWDEVVVAHLLGMTRSEQRPRPSLRDDRSFDHGRPNGTIKWIVGVDGEKFWADLVEKLRDK